MVSASAGGLVDAGCVVDVVCDIATAGARVIAATRESHVVVSMVVRVIFGPMQLEIGFAMGIITHR